MDHPKDRQTLRQTVRPKRTDRDRQTDRPSVFLSVYYCIENHTACIDDPNGQTQMERMAMQPIPAKASTARSRLLSCEVAAVCLVRVRAGVGVGAWVRVGVRVRVRVGVRVVGLGLGLGLGLGFRLGVAHRGRCLRAGGVSVQQQSRHLQRCVTVGRMV